MCLKAQVVSLPFVQHPLGDERIDTVIELPEPRTALRSAIDLWLVRSGSWAARSPFPDRVRLLGWRFSDDLPKIRHEVVAPGNQSLDRNTALLAGTSGGVARFIRFKGIMIAVEVAVHEPPPGDVGIAAYALDPTDVLMTPDMSIDMPDGGMFTLLTETFRSDDAPKFEATFKEGEEYRLTVTLYADDDTARDVVYPLEVATVELE